MEHLEDVPLLVSAARHIMYTILIQLPRNLHSNKGRQVGRRGASARSRGRIQTNGIITSLNATSDTNLW